MKKRHNDLLSERKERDAHEHTLNVDMRGWNINFTHCLVIAFVVSRAKWFWLSLFGNNTVIRRLMLKKLVILFHSLNHCMLCMWREKREKKIRNTNAIPKFQRPLFLFEIETVRVGVYARRWLAPFCILLWFIWCRCVLTVQSLIISWSP